MKVEQRRYACGDDCTQYTVRSGGRGSRVGSDLYAYCVLPTAYCLPKDGAAPPSHKGGAAGRFPGRQADGNRQRIAKSAGPRAAWRCGGCTSTAPTCRADGWLWIGSSDRRLVEGRLFTPALGVVKLDW